MDPYDFDFDTGRFSGGTSPDMFPYNRRPNASARTIYYIVIVILLVLSFVFARLDVWFGI